MLKGEAGCETSLEAAIARVGIPVCTFGLPVAGTRSSMHRSLCLRATDGFHTFLHAESLASRIARAAAWLQTALYINPYAMCTPARANIVMVSMMCAQFQWRSIFLALSR